MKNNLLRFFSFLLLALTISFSSYAQNAPVAVDDGNSTDAGTTLNVAAPGVLDNDSDPDGDVITVASFVIGGTTYTAGTTASLAQGDLTINADGSYTFVPAAGFTGAFPNVTVNVQDDEMPARTDASTLRLFVEDGVSNAHVSISSCNSGYIQPNATYPNGAYKIRYAISFHNLSDAVGYNAASQITNIQVFNDLEAVFGDPCILEIERIDASQSDVSDGQGGTYPREWHDSGNFWDTAEFDDTDPTPGADGIIPAAANNYILYPNQTLTWTYCVYIDPDCGGRDYPHASVDISGISYDFDNVVTTSSSDGAPTDNVLIRDFHTQDSFIVAGLHLGSDAYNYEPAVSTDGTYIFSNEVVIRNDGPTTANDVNYNYGLGNWIDDGITFTSLTLTSSLGSIAVNPNFDGDTDPYLLAPGQTLDPNEEVTIKIDHVVAPTTYQNWNHFSVPNPSMTLGASDGYDETTAANRRVVSFVTWSDAMGVHVDRYDNTENNAAIAAMTSNNQCLCNSGSMRFLHTITLAIDKSILSDVPAASGIAGNRDVTFRLKMYNNASSTVHLEQITLTDNLEAICPGNVVQVFQPPQLVFSNAQVDPNINPNYDGDTDINVLDGNSGILNPGEEFWVDIKVEINNTCSGTNTAYFAGVNPEGENVTVVSDSAIVTAPVNNPPVATDDAVTTDEDVNISGNVITDDLGNGVDSDPDGDPLTITSATIDIDGDGAQDNLPLGTSTALTDAGGNSIGTITLNTDGSFTFVPAPNYYGPVPQTTYTLSDGTLTDTATLDITITPVDDNPSLSVTKVDTYVDSNNDGIQNAGDIINYTIKITNNGGTTLNNVVITDALLGINNQTVGTGTLNPGESETITGSYTLLQSDIDSGAVTNQAIVNSETGLNTPVNQASDDPSTAFLDDPTVSVLTQIVDIEVELTDNIAGTPANSQPLTTSDVINYTLTVENTGNVSVYPSVDSSYTYTGGDTDNDGELDPGEIWTYATTYAVTQADIDNGSIDVQEEVTGIGVNGTPVSDLSDDPDAPGSNDITVTGIIQNPMLTVTKDDSIPANATVGDDIAYTIVVTNTGNVTITNIVLSDPNAYISGNNTIGSLAPGYSVTFNAIHTITQSDMNNGIVSNTATANGEDSLGNTISDDSDDADGVQPGNDDPTISDLTPYQQPEITVTLDDNDPSSPTNPSTYNAGDNINYTLIVENTGNVSLTNVTPPLGYVAVTSGGVNVGDTNGDGILDPGEQWQYTGSYTLTQSNIDVGVYGSQVNVNADFGSTTISDTSDDPQTSVDNDITNTYFNLISEINITKVDTMPFPVMVGQDITYTITVTNNGNTTLSNVTVSDVNATNITYISGDSNNNGMLEPNEIWIYTATHTITQDDMDAGSVANTASVTSNNPQGDTVEDLQSDDTDTPVPNDPTISDLTPYQDPELTTLKIVFNYIDNAPTGNTAGDIIEYQISVENTGNITISNVQVIDNMVSNSGGTVSYYSGDDGNGLLDVGETWTYIAVYTISQSDVDNGEVVNTAVAYGIDSNGVPLNDTSDSNPQLGTPEDPTVTPLVQTPSMEVTKQDALLSNVSVGEYITYTIVVTNTGNVTLYNIAVDDTNATMNGVGSTPLLLPGDSVTFTAVHQITQADMDAGFVNNQATANAEDPNDNPVVDLSDDPDDPTNTDTEGDSEPDDITMTDLTPYQQVSMEVTLDDNVQTNPSNPYNYVVGDLINYTAELINTGNVSIVPNTPSGYVPVEQGGVNVGDTDGDGKLDPGETWIYTTTHTVIQSDIDAGIVTNQVTFNGTAVNGDSVSDLSDDPQDMTTTTYDPTVTYIAQFSELTVVKTGIFTGSTPAVLGDEITYTITVTNTGNQTITNVQVTDPNATVTPPTSQVDLLPGESYDFTATHVLTQADIDAGFVENQATANGEDPNGDPVVDLSDDPSTGVMNDPTIVSVPVHAELTFTKTGVFDDTPPLGNGDGRVDIGEFIVYTFEVSNAGNQTISNVSIDDPLITAQGAIYVSGDTNANNLLDVGETWIYEGYHSLTQSDIDAGMFENQAVVMGEDPAGNTLTDLSDDPNNFADDDQEGDGEPDDPTVTVVPQDPELVLLKEGVFNDENGNGLADVGETISYSFTITNTGNVTLHDVYIDDALPGIQISGTPLVMSPGDSDNSTFTAVYVITKDDIDNGFVTNSAVVSGLTPQNVVIEDISDDPNEMADVDSEGDNEPDDPTVIETLGLVITTIFTPNGDGVNEYWVVPGLQNFPNNTVKIYNRWGNLVFEKSFYTGNWDGYSNGRMVLNPGERLSVGTYFYIIDLGKGAEPFTGYLYLNR